MALFQHKAISVHLRGIFATHQGEGAGSVSAGILHAGGQALGVPEQDPGLPEELQGAHGARRQLRAERYRIPEFFQLVWQFQVRVQLPPSTPAARCKYI